MVDLHAEGFEVRLDLGNQGKDPRVIRRHQVDLEVGDASIAQELGGGVLVVGQIGRGLLVRRVGLRQEGGRLNGLSFQCGADQLLLVDGLHEGAAHLGLVEGRFLRVEHQEGVAVAGLGLDVPAGSLELILGGRGDGLHDVDGTANGGGQTGRVILEGLPLEGRGLGRFVTVVVLVGNRGDLGRRDVLILVRTGTDRLGLQRVLTHGCGNNANVDETLLQVREGVLQRDRDGLIVLGFDGVDEGEELTVDGLLGRRAFVGGDEVRGRHVGAVGELRSVAQADLVLGVGNLHGVTGGQCGADGVVGHIEPVQALEDLPVRAHAECRGSDRPVVGGLVGNASGQSIVCAPSAAGRSATAARGQDQCSRCGQRRAGREVFTHSHALAPHLREMERADLLCSARYT